MDGPSKTIKQLEFDATHSWNGFCYQGKIALIVTIDFIISLVKEKKDIKPYKLEFEYLEDFSIIKNEEYIQIHQVKSYGMESLSNYKDAIWLLLGKSVYEGYSTIQKSFLHTADTITSRKGEIKSKKLLKEVLETYNKPSSSDSDTLKSPRDLYQYVKEMEQFETAFEKFNLYTYSSDNMYCSLLEVENLVKEKIIEYFETVGKKKYLEKRGILEAFVEGSYVCLLGLIDSHINQRHYSRQNHSENFKRQVDFLEIYTILNEDYIKLPLAYYIFYLKDKMLETFNVYYLEQMQFIKSTFESSSTDLASIKECEKVKRNLESVMRILKDIYTTFSDNEFIAFFHKINPHILINLEEDYVSLSELVNPQFLNYPWFQSLVDLAETIDNQEYLIRINKNFYLASTISHTIQPPDEYDTEFYKHQINARIEAAISKIAVNVIENKKIHQELYKIDNIITGNINKPLKQYINKATKYHEIKNHNENYHIMDIKNVELVDLRQCKIRRGTDE